MGSKTSKQNLTPLISIVLLGLNGTQLDVAKYYYKTIRGIESNIQSMNFFEIRNSITIDNDNGIKNYIARIWYFNLLECVIWESVKKVLGAGIVFDITDKKTFDNLDKYIQKINEKHNRYFFTLILIGNKCECQSGRKVFKEEAKKFADMNKMKYFEVSSNTGEGVKECIDYLIEQSFQKYLELNNKK